MTNEIRVVRGIAPDTTNGGEIFNGVLVGPTITTNHWQIGTEKKLYSSRPKAEKELKRRRLNAEIFAVMGFGQGGAVSMPAEEIVRIIRTNGKALKNILIDRKYTSLIS